MKTGITLAAFGTLLFCALSSSLALDGAQPGRARRDGAPGTPSSGDRSSPNTPNFKTHAVAILVPEIEPREGNTYFTRISFFYEKGRHIATNYGRGIAVPINTEVEYIGINRKGFSIRRLDTKEAINMENVPEYSGKSNVALPSRYLSDRKAPIETLSNDLQIAIRAGQLRLGMTKEQALLARGYPPAHETPSIDMDRWVYWSSRFVRQSIIFREGRLVEGRGLY